MMNKRISLIFIAVLLILQLAVGGVATFALMADANNDIVGGASDDIAGGSSVFVFKVPKKQPHMRSSARSKAVFKRTIAAKIEARRKRQQETLALARNRAKSPNNNNSAVGFKARAPRVVPKEKQAETLALAGRKLLDAKNFAGAEAKFKQARALNPNNQDAAIGLLAAYIARGDQAFAAKDFKTAAATYELALGLDADNAEVYAAMGEAYDQLEQPGKAILAYENAYKRGKELNSLVPTIAALSYETGDYARAATYYETALKSDPKDAELNNSLGLALTKQDKTLEAIAAFQRAIQILPQFAEAHYNLGEVYDKTNREKEAVAEYQEAIRQDPSFAEPHYGLGVIAYNRERYAESVPHYEKAILLKPNYTDAKNNLADALRQQEKFAEAVAVYKTIVPETPSDPVLYSKYGYCAGKANDWNESAKLLEKSAELDGTADDTANVAWAYNNAGRKAAKEKNQELAKQNHQKAKENAEKAQQKDPKSASAKFNLGDSLTALGEATLAVAAFRGALGLKSNWAEAHNGLGLALIAAGDLAGASGEFRSATGINNSFVGAFANLAIVESKRGNKKEAEKAKARVKQLNPKMAAALDSYIAQYLMNRVEQKVREKTVNKIKNKIPLPF